ncbi:MAG: N-methyl-L-tryptophan oxidase [Verrucomicrobia bacterium]|nr:N-methyl-L-tryptophan oxidase [Verrucomicrobiota bacterium]
MESTFDVIVAGLGAMGSATAFHLASRGLRVLGLDRLEPPHCLGSSHGQTRIIREAYFEHPAYVPLVQRAYELWAELQERSGESLLLLTGGLMIGPESGVLFPGALRSAQTHRLPHEVLSSDDVVRRFPALRPESTQKAVWEPRAGVLFPERCVARHLQAARDCGDVLRTGEAVTKWEPDGAGVRVETSGGAYRSGALVVAAGAWAQSLFPTWRLPFTVERQTLFWFEAARRAELFQRERCPIHLWETPEGEFFYGFPDLGDGVKLACHHGGPPTTPETVSREVTAADESAMRRLARRFIPDAEGRTRSATVCLYTNTPDSHFWLDHHPDHPQVWIASPCSGHGFKFASVIGEIMADAATGRRSPFDLSLFRARAVAPSCANPLGARR